MSLPKSKGDHTYTNIFAFLLLTVAYFSLMKPRLTVDVLANPSAYVAFSKKSHIMLGVYVLAVIVLQFIINTQSVVNKCGGSSTQNMGVAAMYTFFPWIFIFGILIVVLILFPGFKGAFSDVVGYFLVAGSANTVLTSLLIDPSVQDKIQELGPSPTISPPPTLQQPQQGGDGEGEGEGINNKKSMQEAADAIVKLCGNMSILINQIVPGNFIKYWDTLTPLMKPQYQDPNSGETLSIKQKLLDLVSTRDNIGEATWYIYTAILLISIVQFKLVTRGCNQTADTLMANYAQYDSKVTADSEKNAKAKARSYVVE